MCSIRREGGSSRRRGWCTKGNGDARRQVSNGVGHVGDRMFQAVESLVDTVIRVTQPRARMSVWCLGVFRVGGGMRVCCRVVGWHCRVIVVVGDGRRMVRRRSRCVVIVVSGRASVSSSLCVWRRGWELLRQWSMGCSKQRCRCMAGGRLEERLEGPSSASS